MPSTKLTNRRKSLANRRGRKPTSVREQKIQAALRAAMRQEKAPAKAEKKPLNRMMELALAEAGVTAPGETKETLKVDRPERGVRAAPDSGNEKKRKNANPKRHSKQNQQRKLTDDEKAQVQRLARQKRKAKDAAKRLAANKRRAAAEHAAQREKERRESARLAAIELFISTIQQASFAELLSTWRKHVELVAFIRATGNKRDRLSLYERLVHAVEGEWKRRSKLRHSDDEYFDWPTTDAKRGHGRFGEVSWVTEGVLGYLGYAVGETSTLTQSQRQAVLRRIFQMHLPPIESPSYMEEWASPQSAPRLKKMANSIASFARQAKRRRNADMREAIGSWETDLRMLHDEYYVGHFGFGWPST